VAERTPTWLDRVKALRYTAMRVYEFSSEETAFRGGLLIFLNDFSYSLKTNSKGRFI